CISQGGSKGGPQTMQLWRPNRTVMTVLTVGLFLAVAPAAFAELAIDQVALATTIENREPASPLAPAAFCEKDNAGGDSLPVLHTDTLSTVYFWTRVQATEPGLLRHTWMQKGEAGWEQMAQISLNIAASSGYRTWSSKQIDPSLHRGEWMVQVTSDANPDQVLCLARFRVEGGLSTQEMSEQVGDDRGAADPGAEHAAQGGQHERQ
ncbi:MAG: DUF2914 domain-containing protein, partial [Nitrospirales bacterium]